MKNEEKKQRLNGFFALLLFGIFAVCILLVLLLGADSYQRMMERDRSTYEERTAVQYLTTRVRQADAFGSVSVQTLEGQEVLVLSEMSEGESYETMLYCYAGWLMECYTAAGNAPALMDGERILEIEALSFSMAEDGLQIRLTMPDGAEKEIFLGLRSGKER